MEEQATYQVAAPQEADGMIHRTRGVLEQHDELKEHHAAAKGARATFKEKRYAFVKDVEAKAWLLVKLLVHALFLRA